MSAWTRFVTKAGMTMRILPKFSREVEEKAVQWYFHWLDGGIAVCMARDWVWWDEARDGCKRIQIISLVLTKTPDPNMIRLTVGPVQVFITHFGLDDVLRAEDG